MIPASGGLLLLVVTGFSAGITLDDLDDDSWNGDDIEYDGTPLQSCGIDSYHVSALTLSVFQTEYQGMKPVLIRGATLHWPAQALWSKAYLRKRFENFTFYVKMASEAPASQPIGRQHTSSATITTTMETDPSLLNEKMSWSDYLGQMYPKCADPWASTEPDSETHNTNKCVMNNPSYIFAELGQPFHE